MPTQSATRSGFTTRWALELASCFALATACEPAHRHAHDAHDTPGRAPAFEPDSTDAHPASDGEPTNEVHRPLPGPLAACIARVAGNTPPELATALATAEYFAAAEDGCRIDFATRLRDPALCDGIALSDLRSACLGRAAIAGGVPEQCPPGGLDRGRDALCVALASRSMGLCAAAAGADRVRCYAIARGDASQCTSLDPLLRPRCQLELAALAPSVGHLGGIPLPPGTLRVRITFGAAIDGGGVTTEHSLTALARGAFESPDGTLWLLDPVRGWPTETGVSLTPGEPVVGVALRMPVHPGRGALAGLRIVRSNGMVIDVPRSAPAQVTLQRVARTRGGAVSGSVTADGFATGVAAHIEIEFQTFVRDIVPRSVLAAPSDDTR